MIVTAAIGVNTVSARGKEEGRIVAVRPADWQWGKEEVKQFLIVKLDLGDSVKTIQEAQKLTIPQYSNGSVTDIDVEKNPTVTIDCKRRYKISFTDISTLATAAGKTIDFAKVRDMTIEYQPIKDTTISANNLVYDRYADKKLETAAISSSK